MPANILFPGAVRWKDVVFMRSPAEPFQGIKITRQDKLQTYPGNKRKTLVNQYLVFYGVFSITVDAVAQLAGDPGILAFREQESPGTDFYYP